MDNLSANYKIIQKKIRQYFSGERKFLTFVLLLLIGFLLIAIAGPYLINQKKDNWEQILAGKILENKTGTLKQFEILQSQLVSDAQKAKFNLINDQPASDESLRKFLFRKLNDPSFLNYEIALYDSIGNLRAWNNNITTRKPVSPPGNSGTGITFFKTTPLKTTLAFFDSVIIDNSKYWLSFEKLLEKKYTFEIGRQTGYSLTSELEDKFQTNIAITYNPSKSKSKDGRNSSFEILNNRGEKIGLVTVAVPTLNLELNSFRDKISSVQSLLLVLAFLMLGFGLKSDYKKLKFRSLKIALFIIYILFLRFILYYLDIPANLVWQELSDPSHFSSSMGGGIVKSPLELFMTAVAFLAVILYLSNQYSNYFTHYARNKNRSSFFILIPVTAFFVFGFIRILSASIKSIIYDSSLNYFAGSDLLPDFIILFMNFSLLLLASSIALLIVLLLAHNFSWLQTKNKFQFTVYVGFFAIIYLVGFLIYSFAQSEPLITPTLLFLTLFLLFLVSFKISRQATIKTVDYLTIIVFSSIISISYLNYFNLLQEKESLRTIAYNINRQNESLRTFLVGEALLESYSSEELVDGLLGRETDFNSLAFWVWSRSAMKNEDVSSAITILDKNRKIVGSFSTGLPEKDLVPQIALALPADELKTFDLINNETGEKIVSGIIPIKDRNKKIGYICATVVVKHPSSAVPDVHKLLYSDKRKRDISSTSANIFSLSNREVTPYRSDLFLDRQVIDLIRTGTYNELGELWSEAKINNEDHVLFALRQIIGKDTNHIVVTLKEKDLEWSVFNFLKLFILHSIFLVVLIFISLIKNLPELKKLRFTFKSQLLASFLIISLIPLLALAIYNRFSVSEKSENLVRSSLREKATLIEEHIKTQLKNNPDRSVLTAVEKAHKELKISYNFYDSSRIAFTTNYDLLAAGIIPDLLNPLPLQSLRLIGLNEDFVKNKYENVEYHSFYRKARINNRSYIIEVNDIFNKLDNPFSPLEIDVFIFGSYSVAILIIILVSTMLAGKISAPIRNLTNATNSVAHGDLNVRVEKVEFGEIKDLIDGFNYMTSEIKRNQHELAELERESAWREMAKQVAHEIKNPLTPMKLAVQQLIASYKDAGKNFDVIFQKVTNTVLQQIDTLSQIASEFSRFARMPGINLTNINLVHTVNEVVNLFIHEKISIRFSSDLDTAVIEADENNLRRVFINIVRNSIQARANIINITLSDEDNFFIISVSDNGTGIPDDLKDRIFDPDFSTKKSGMGLGLKMAKKFISGIGGDIYLNKQNTETTEFIIKLLKTVTSDSVLKENKE